MIAAVSTAVTAVKKSTDPTPQILQRFAYTYDPAGNRTAEQIDDALTTSTYNNMNQLVSQAPGGLLRFEGTLNEPATVTIGGKPAMVTDGGVAATAAHSKRWLSPNEEDSSREIHTKGLRRRLGYSGRHGDWPNVAAVILGTAHLESGILGDA